MIAERLEELRDGRSKALAVANAHIGAIEEMVKLHALAEQMEAEGEGEESWPLDPAEEDDDGDS